MILHSIPDGVPRLRFPSPQARTAGCSPFTVRQANALDVPLITTFGLDASYPEANERHFP
jgi:hypothetical protein